jgi:hypothetical protein
MSSSLKWDIVRDPKGKYLSDATKHILRESYGEGGTIRDVELGAHDVPYLAGVRDATTNEEVKKDMDLLIGQISEHGNSIKIWEEF